MSIRGERHLSRCFEGIDIKILQKPQGHTFLHDKNPAKIKWTMTSFSVKTLRCCSNTFEAHTDALAATASYEIISVHTGSQLEERTLQLAYAAHIALALA